MFVRVIRQWGASSPNSNLARRMAAGLCALACLSLALPGCGHGRRGADHVKVTGKVTYKNKPVTGGRITFVLIPTDPEKEQPFSNGGTIDENGNYAVDAPLGNVKITVDNKMLNTSGLSKGAKQVMARGAGNPNQQPSQDAIKGTYMYIPDKYRNTETTDLTWTVTKDQTTHDIDLK